MSSFANKNLFIIQLQEVTNHETALFEVSSQKVAFILKIISNVSTPAFLEVYVVFVVSSGKITIYFDFSSKLPKTEIDQEHLKKVHVEKLISNILGAKSILLRYEKSFWLAISDSLSDEQSKLYLAKMVEKYG